MGLAPAGRERGLPLQPVQFQRVRRAAELGLERRHQGLGLAGDRPTPELRTGPSPRPSIPTTSRALPSGRIANRTPSARVRCCSITRSPTSDAAPRYLWIALESSVRHWPSLPSTRFRIALWMCSCGSWSRESCWKNDATVQSCASTQRPAAPPWCPTREYPAFCDRYSTAAWFPAQIASSTAWRYADHDAGLRLGRLERGGQPLGLAAMHRCRCTGCRTAAAPRCTGCTGRCTGQRSQCGAGVSRLHCGPALPGLRTRCAAP